MRGVEVANQLEQLLAHLLCCQAIAYSPLAQHDHTIDLNLETRRLRMCATVSQQFDGGYMGGSTAGTGHGAMPAKRAREEFVGGTCMSSWQRCATCSTRLEGCIYSEPPWQNVCNLTVGLGHAGP